MAWEFLDFQTPLGLTFGQIIIILAVTAVAFVLERLMTRYLKIWQTGTSSSKCFKQFDFDLSNFDSSFRCFSCGSCGRIDD